MITRSFALVWRFKYLWLLAILGGADVGSGGFSGNFSNVGNLGRAGQIPGGGSGPSSADVTQFFQDYAGLFVLVLLIALVIGIAWFLLSCVTTGALIRASAEHDAERPFGFGMAWRTGMGTFPSILGLRLLGLLAFVVAAVVVGGMVLLGFAAYSGGQSGLLAAIIALGVLVGLALVIAAILVGLAFILAARSIVLEQRGTMAAVARAFELLRSRLGRVLLVWLIQVGLGIAGGFALVIVAIPVVAIVAGIVAFAAVTGNAAVAFVLGIPVGLIVLALLIAVGGAIGAYFSTYWTLAFRRLELETPAPAAYPPAAYPPQPAG